jgi:putative transposase
MKFVFIAKHRTIWPVAWLCDALGVSRSGFHAWLNPIAQCQIPQ